MSRALSSDRGAFGWRALCAWGVAVAKIERPRAFLWSPVALGLGIALYFGWQSEPALDYTAPCGALALWGCLFGHSLWLRALALAVFGFALASFATLLYGTPMIDRPLPPMHISGRIVDLEQHGDGLRLLLDEVATGRDERLMPKRIHLVVGDRLLKKMDAAQFTPGARVDAVAQLLPLSEPLAPGGFDFRRSSFFRGIGATGYIMGKLSVRPSDTVATSPYDPALWLAGWRRNLQTQIHGALSGDRAGLAIVLLTGDKTALSPDTTEAMRAVGLAHLLAIAGLHVGLFAGITFWVIRALLALSERLTLRYPIKKWAAGFALGAAIFYTLQVGAPVPTERALMMTGGVLVGIMLDRIVLSLRLIALAALVILIAMPYQLLNPSFQLSFAAVLALIATGETARRNGWTLFRGYEGWVFVALRHIVSIVVMSAVATLATLPFSLYHFQEAGLYSMAANALAIPLTSLWLMPCCVLADVLAPFGLASLPLRLMGPGLGLLIGIAHGISGWPGAFYEPPQMPFLLLVFVVAGGLAACLLASRLRWVGLAIYVAAVLLGFCGRTPNLLVSADGRMVGWSDGAHRLAIAHIGKIDAFTADVWAHLTSTPAANVVDLESIDTNTKPYRNFKCMDGACVWNPQGMVGPIAWVEDPMALPELCVLNPRIVITPMAPWPCLPVKPLPLIVDGRALRQYGAHMFFVSEQSIMVDTVRSLNANPRPWTPGWQKWLAADDPEDPESERDGG